MAVIQRSAAPVIPDEKTTEELLRELVLQLKIQNAHLSIMTDEELDEQDVEEAE